MTRQQAVYVAYMLAEALNTTGMADILQRAYGTNGMKAAYDSIMSLAKDHGFEPPVMVTRP